MITAKGGGGAIVNAESKGVRVAFLALLVGTASVVAWLAREGVKH